MGATVTNAEQKAGGKTVSLRPITDGDALGVGTFLTENLNHHITAQKWAEALTPTWQVDAPNHGFMLVAGDEIVGVQLAFYSQRQTANGVERFCNVAAFCVSKDYRLHSLRLLKALLSQRDYVFTDLSASGNVRPLNKRLGFQQLDTATALVPNLPWPLFPLGSRVVTDPAAIGAMLTGSDLDIYRDHLGAHAANHLMLTHGDEHCYVIFRKDRRKNLPLFATILHVGNPALFQRLGGHFFRHLLVRHAIPLTLAELRVVKSRPLPSVMLQSNRAKMFLSDRVGPDSIDYLYSELTCVAW